MKRFTLSFLVSSAVALTAASAQADVFSAAATTNATYELDGLTGQEFFLNAQGAGGDFDEFSAIDFSVNDLGLPADIDTLNSVTYQVLEDAAPFAQPGEVELFLASDTSFDLRDEAGAAGSITFDDTDAPAGVGGQFGTLTSLGTFDYDPANGGGFVYEWAFDLSGGVGDTLVDLLNTPDATLRLIFAAADGSVVATTAGNTSFDYDDSNLAGPTLSVDATLVPEPASLVLFAAGGALVMGRRRRSA